ncbi:MAG: hypothetical protein V7645_1206 [Actinomycetota bacterium]
MSAISVESPSLNATRTPERPQRFLPIAGILFGILLALALWLTSKEPSDTASARQVFAYWSDHGGGKMWLSILGLELAAVLLVSFGAALRASIGSAEGPTATYSSLAFGGAILAAMGFAVTSILPAAAGRAAADKAAEPGAQTAVYAIEQLRSWDWLMWTPGLTVMMVAAGLGGLRTRALPKTLSWAAVVLGVAFFTPLGFFAFFILPPWMIATGVVLYRYQRTVAAGAPA